MKDSKAVYATTYELDGNLNREYELFANREVTINSSDESNEKTKEFGCQYDKNSVCTCKRIKRKEIRYYTSSRQVYRSQRYSSARGFTDIGVGNVKTLPKKRVRKIYLPETIDAGIGSSDLTLLFSKTKNWGGSYYEQKKTSSKCIGGVMDCMNISVVSEKLSPIVHTTSGSNSPKITSIENINKVIILANNEPTCSKTEDIETPSPPTNVIIRKQKEAIATLTEMAPENMVNCKKSNEKLTTSVNKAKSNIMKANTDDKDFSSDSLIQHVHNLENPSDYKQSRISIDFIENKLEREYRKIFSTKHKERKQIDDKTVSDIKSASALRRRFEALRRGKGKKDETKTDVVMNVSSRVSIPSKKDVSIVSDPPSLEARSYSNTKIFSPLPSKICPTGKNKVIPHTKTSTRKSLTGKKVPSQNWSTDVVDSDCQGVKGMFKLWGKKFNLDEDNYDTVSPLYSKNTTKEREKRADIVVPRKEVIMKEKKEGKKFSFFRKRSKDKSKQTYKSRKGVTAGRCEVDGLMIKIGAANEYPLEPPLKKSHRKPEEYNDILRKAWLKRFLSSQVDSKHSAQIRWNNNMYTTSSSTVFELLDCVYKNTGIIFRSKSEMTTEESSFYQSFTNPQVNFMHQSIQAWMMSETTRNNQMIIFNNKKESKNIEVRCSNQNWFIEKSKAFARKIEVVLHSKNLVQQDDDNSSDYIMIHIPEGYFSDTSSNEEDTSQTSDEQVYNIVEYETGNSNSYVKKQKKDNKMETGDHAFNEIQVTVSVKDSRNNESNVLETVIKRPPLQRDVVLQGSNVYVPKRCDVIGVGIITQRDIRDIKKPILKLQDELTDDSEHILPPQKKCEFAESYLQDYYRNWTPLGLDLFSWCVSDSHLPGSSENNSLNSLNQGDGSKSCPNIYDDYQASTIISSCNTSSCSHCLNFENEKKVEDVKKQKLFAKFKKKQDSPNVGSDTKRILPKDSLAVFRRRKMYALSNKAVWATMDSSIKPCCVPSVGDKGEQKSSNECPIPITPKCCKAVEKPEKPKKHCQKHVSMQNCNVLNNLLKQQLSDHRVEGILTFKGAGGCDNCKKPDIPSKRARVIPEPTCEIPHPPCIDSCTKKRKPPCSKKNSPSCHKPPPPVCPVGPPTPCQPACPPIAPPCARGSPCAPYTPPCPISPCPLSKPSPTCSQLPPCPKPPPSTPYTPPCPISTCPGSKPSSTCTELPPCPKPTPSIPRCTPPSELPQRPCCCPPKQSPSDSPKCPAQSPPSINYRRRKHSCSNLSPPCTPSPQPSCSPSPPPPCPPSRSPPCPPSRPPPCPPSPPTPCSPSPPPSCPPSPPPPCPPSRPPPCPQSRPPPCPQSRPPPCPPSPPPPCPPSGPPPCPKSRPPPCSPSPPPSCPPSPPPPCPPSRPPPCPKSRPPPCSPSPPPSCPPSPPPPCPPSPPPPCPPSPPPPCSHPSKVTSTRSQTKCKKCLSQEFPWPLKNQMSNCPSKESGLCRKTSPIATISDKISAGIKNLIKKFSGSSLKECRPDCANRSRATKCQPPKNQPKREPKVIRSRSKMPGLHLKKLPMPQCPSKECISWGDDNDGVIRLNSKEQITINLKKRSDSTEEIRENCNMKVRDFDGQTLYERRDYQNCDKRSYLVKDMYRDSQVQRVATSNADMLGEKNSEDNISIPNIIEINLGLKFKQGDKTKINLNNYGETQKELNEMSDAQHESQKEVYLVHDQQKPFTIKSEKKDLDIKIIIKNYKQQSINTQRSNKHCVNIAADDKFSRKISEKFHTVSTGYSDVFEQQAYSIHRTTIDLTDSHETNKVQGNPSEVIVNEHFTDNNPFSDMQSDGMVIKSSKTSNTKSSMIMVNLKNEDEISLSSKTNSITGVKVNSEKIDETNDERSETGLSTTDNEDAIMSDIRHESNDNIIPKIHKKEEKKAVLKQIFESANKIKSKGAKSKMQNIRKMLRAVLTSDSSGHEDIAVNNELVNELTYASLKPNYFKNSESMTNYYLYDSSMSINKGSNTDVEETLYPTEDNNSECSGESNKNKCGACLCSQFAAKLNIKQNKNGCCCRSEKRDQETVCDIFDENCYRSKTEYVDVETQDSKYFGKIRANVTDQSVIINETELDPRFTKPKMNKLKMFTPYSNAIKACQVKRINRSTILGLSDDDKVVILNSNNEMSFSECLKAKRIKPADILQSQETKKAVLEIYAEKTITNNRERIVAKLPKFVYNKESEIRHYEEILTGCSTRNIVMMSITQ